MTITSNPPLTKRRVTVYPPRALQGELKKIRLSLGRDPSTAVINRALDALDIVRAKVEHIASLQGMYPDWTRLDAIAAKATRSRRAPAKRQHWRYPAGTSKFIREVLRSASALLMAPISLEERCDLLAKILECSIAMIGRLAQLASTRRGSFTHADVMKVVHQMQAPAPVDYWKTKFMLNYRPYTMKAGELRA